MFTAVLFTIARTWRQAKWIKKKKIWHIYTMKYYSVIQRNKFESVELRWMNLEPFIQNEVSQKHILYINAYRWNLEKWYSWAYLQGRNTDTDIENRLVDTEDEGEGGTDRQGPWNIHITYVKRELMGSCCITRGAQPSALYNQEDECSGGGR